MLAYGANFMYLKFMLHFISEWAVWELSGKKAYIHPQPPFIIDGSFAGLSSEN